jgi:TolB-like protein/class 3 adenylate cyclase/tetratricopeptide (TPR) repeat protein
LIGDRVERRLAAVLAADVAGYSRLMGGDEEGTLAKLKALRKALIDPKVTEHRGRIVKTTGDGMLVEFASAVDAARCAVEVQRDMAGQNIDIPQNNRIEFRIGIHVGDIIFDDNDIFGDGVNIAARLEGIAEPGGVCISDDAHRQIRGKVDFSYNDMGLQTLKNIAEPMHVWRMRLGSDASSAFPLYSSIVPVQVLALPDRPSIAVLPFQNMSGDAEQEYFADGIAEDIITALSRFKSLFVIARNSSFTYKGKAVDIKQVGRELGVRYVLEGSVRKAAGKVRITGQLIDAATGTHLWADRFDGSLEDIFELQDQVTTSVIGAVAPKLEEAEIERAHRKPTEMLDAYDYYLRGLAKVSQYTRTTNGEALRFFNEAIGLDPEYASAHAMATRCVTLKKQNGWLTNPKQEVFEGLRLARRALELGRDDPLVLAVGGFALAFLGRDLDSGAIFVARSLSLNANNALAWLLSGAVQVLLGEPELGIAHVARAQRLSPLDPTKPQFMACTALCHFCAGRFADASLWAENALREQDNLLTPLLVLAASAAHMGRLEDAQRFVPRVLHVSPSYRVSRIKDGVPFRRPQDLALLSEGLRLAGIAE